MIISVIAIVMLTGVLAFFTPPNNFDAMVYRLPRIEHWIFNQTLSHYPTNIARQLFSNPLTEFFILHFRLMTGSDIFSNSIQWFALIGILAGISLVSEKLGLDHKGKWLAIIFAITTPIVLLQAAAAQNDLLNAFYLTAFVSYLLNWLKNRLKADLFLMSTALGLAICTKGTAYIFGFAFFAAFILSELMTRKNGWAKTIAIASILTALPLTGHYARNHIYYGKVITNEGGVREEFKISNTLSNLIKAFGTNIATPSRSANEAIRATVESSHKLLGLNYHATEASVHGRPYTIDTMPFHEESAGNPFHFIIILSVIPLVLLQNFKICRGNSTPESASQQFRLRAIYAACLIVSGLFFISTVKWQPWLNRLSTPLMIMAAPLSGWILARLSKKFLAIFLLTAIICSMPVILMNSRKPILGKTFLERTLPFLASHSWQPDSVFALTRFENMFNMTDLLPPFVKTAQIIKTMGHVNIGLATNYNFPEYYLYALLHHLGAAHRIEHLRIDDPKIPRNYPGGPFSPTIVIATRDQGATTEFNSQKFVKIKGDFAGMFLYSIYDGQHKHEQSD